MLLRFFKKKEYALEFLNGNIYCNSMEFFRSSITDYTTEQLTASGCLDILEGSVQLMKHYFPYQENKMYKDFSEHLCYDSHISLPEYSKSHICCFFQYTKGSNISSMEGFGEWCVLIYDFDCFLRKIQTAIAKTPGLYFLTGAVEYYKRTINNSVVKNDSNMLVMSLDGYQIHFNEYNKAFIFRDAFCKINRFKTQQEWRLFLYKDNWNTEPFILQVGSLEDCCQIISRDKVENAGYYLDANKVKQRITGNIMRENLNRKIINKNPWGKMYFAVGDPGKTAHMGEEIISSIPPLYIRETEESKRATIRLILTKGGKVFLR